jgi:hypothetical protein
LGRMSSVQWGCALEMQERSEEDKQEMIGDLIDHRFDHSWIPNGPEHGPGWFWIPKGNITMETCYPAQQNEIRRFGYLAKRVRRLPPLRCSPSPFPRSWRLGWRTVSNSGRQREGRRIGGRRDGWRRMIFFRKTSDMSKI